MNKPKANGNYPAKQQKDNDTRRPDILYNCRYPGKPGTSICTNGKQYKYQYVTTRVGNNTKRELLPVYDPTALFNINAPKRAAEREKRRLSQTTAPFRHPCASKSGTEVLIGWLRKENCRKKDIIDSLESRLRSIQRLNISQFKTIEGYKLQIRTLKRDNNKKARVLKKAQQINLTFLAHAKGEEEKTDSLKSKLNASGNHNLMQQSLLAEISELKENKVKLLTKIERMSETYNNTASQFVDSIVSLSKLRKELDLIQFGRKRQTLDMKSLEREIEYLFLEQCMTKFDNFCNISSSSASKVSAIHDKSENVVGILSQVYYIPGIMFNQLRRFFRYVAGLQLMEPGSELM